MLNKNFTQLVGELLGSSLNAFAVESQEDLITLRSIFEQTKWYGIGTRIYPAHITNLLRLLAHTKYGNMTSHP